VVLDTFGPSQCPDLSEIAQGTHWGRRTENHLSPQEVITSWGGRTTAAVIRF
jgi:hypothetical protein